MSCTIQLYILVETTATLSVSCQRHSQRCNAAPSDLCTSAEAVLKQLLLKPVSTLTLQEPDGQLLRMVCVSIQVKENCYKKIILLGLT